MSAQKGYIVPMVLFGTVALISGIGLLLFLTFYKKPVSVNSALAPTPIPSVSEVEVIDFESCEKAGYPIQESYPRSCEAQGVTFTEIIASPSPSSNGEISVIKPSFPLLSSDMTSPEGSYMVSEFQQGDKNTIVIKDNQNNIITDDLLMKNENQIGMGTKYQCQCGLHFRGWFDNKTFIIYVNNAIGEEYEFKVNVEQGVVDEDSFQRVK